jgi:hypothetical protein
MAEAAIVDEVQGDQVVPIKPAGEVKVYIWLEMCECLSCMHGYTVDQPNPTKGFKKCISDQAWGVQ